MNVAINNRFGILLAEKRAQEKRNIPLSEVSEAIGVPPKTLLAWANNTVTRFDVHVIDAICKYFGVKPGDLFEYVEGPTSQPKKLKQKTARK
jgi:DNA-binding Xre family transcriptional regulator